MKHITKSSALLLLAALSATAGVSKYAGIYSGKAQNGVKFVAAASPGGRMIGMDDEAEGLRDSLNPARSTINSRGKIKASSPSGSSVVAAVNLRYRLSGTIKVQGRTLRISGKRIYK